MYIQVHSINKQQTISYIYTNTIKLCKPQQYNIHRNHLHDSKHFMYTSTSNFLVTYKYNQLMQRATPTNIKIIYIVENIQSTLLNQQTNS